MTGLARAAEIDKTKCGRAVLPVEYEEPALVHEGRVFGVEIGESAANRPRLDGASLVGAFETERDVTPLRRHPQAARAESSGEFSLCRGCEGLGAHPMGGDQKRIADEARRKQRRSQKATEDSGGCSGQ